MSKIIVRRLDENWDPVYGTGRNAYIADLDALTQIVQTKLRLWKGEWWEDRNEGLPMMQQILGKMGTTQMIADRLIQKRIMEVPYVIRISDFYSTFNRETRGYECEATIETEFGTVLVSST